MMPTVQVVFHDDHGAYEKLLKKRVCSTVMKTVALCFYAYCA